MLHIESERLRLYRRGQEPTVPKARSLGRVRVLVLPEIPRVQGERVLIEGAVADLRQI